MTGDLVKVSGNRWKAVAHDRNLGRNRYEVGLRPAVDVERINDDYDHAKLIGSNHYKC